MYMNARTLAKNVLQLTSSGLRAAIDATLLNYVRSSFRFHEVQRDMSFLLGWGPIILRPPQLAQQFNPSLISLTMKVTTDCYFECQGFDSSPASLRIFVVFLTLTYSYK
jgi:hypothetical protein